MPRVVVIYKGSKKRRKSSTLVYLSTILGSEGRKCTVPDRRTVGTVQGLIPKQMMLIMGSLTARVMSLHRNIQPST